METRYDLRKIGICHEQKDLDAHDATKLLIKEIERLRDALTWIERHPVEESKQWEVAVKEIKRIARSVLQQKDNPQ